MSEGNILNLLFAFSLLLGPKLTSCCFHTEAVGTSSPLRLQISGHSINLNFRPLADRAFHKRSLFSLHLSLQTGQFWATCLFLCILLKITRSSHHNRSTFSQPVPLLLVWLWWEMRLAFRVSQANVLPTAFPCHKMVD